MIKITIVGEGEKFAIRKGGNLAFFRVRNSQVRLVPEELALKEDDWSLKYAEPIALGVGDRINVYGQEFILTRTGRRLNEPAYVEFKQPIELTEK